MKRLFLLGFCFASLSYSQLVIGAFTAHNLKYLWPGVGLLAEERAFLNLSPIGRGLSWVPSGSQTVMTAMPGTHIDPPPIQWLLESNKPEKLVDYGLVYQQKNLEGSSRLMLFHLNKTEKRGYITLKVTPSSPSMVWLKGGVSGPDTSELYVGQRLMRTFFDSDQSAFGVENGYTRTWAVGPEQVLGGLLDIWLTPKGLYDVEVYFHENVTRDAFEPLVGASPCFAYHELVSRIIMKEDSLRYNINIGREGYLQSGTETLEGNYGVMHRYNIVFLFTGTYVVSFTANGGPARLIARVGDQIWSSYAKTEAKVLELDIASPQEILIETIPLPGSNYPATLTIQKKP